MDWIQQLQWLMTSFVQHTEMIGHTWRFHVVNCTFIFIDFAKPKSRAPVTIIKLTWLEPVIKSKTSSWWMVNFKKRANTKIFFTQRVKKCWLHKNVWLKRCSLHFRNCRMLISQCAGFLVSVPRSQKFETLHQLFQLAKPSYYWYITKL